MLDLLFLAGAGTPFQELLSGLVVSSNPGFCNFDSVGDPSTITINWSVAQPADPAYHVLVFVNGILNTTLETSAAQTFTVFAPGDVENGGQSQFGATTEFEIRYARKSDGEVLKSLSTSYSSTYGTCR